jgi:hypothetical protein
LDFLAGCDYLNLELNIKNSSVHHILWQREYKRFSKCDWNKIRLSNKDHIRASALMVAAEPENVYLMKGLIATAKMSRSYFRWRPKNPRKIIQLYVKHFWSLKKLGRQFKVCGGTIKTFLQDNKIEIRKDYEHRLWRPRQPQQVILLYSRYKWSAIRIGKKFGVSEFTIRKFLWNNNVYIRSYKEGKIWHPKSPDEVIILYKKGLSFQYIGDKFGVSKTAVRSFLVRSKIRLRSRRETQVLRHRLIEAGRLR